MRELADWTVTYLLNAAWQVPVVFAAAWLSARLMERLSARAEHRTWVGALAVAVVLPACHLNWTRLFPVAVGAGAAGRVETKVSLAGAASHGHGLLQLPVWAVSALLVAYGCALLFFAVRLAWGLWRTERIRRQASPATLAGEIEASRDRYCRKFGVGDTEIAVSPAVSGPVVVGMRRPVLLVPEGFLDTVAAAEWETALAHEFAHIERRDFAKNVLYGTLSLPVAWHPVARLVAARIAESREVVCDEMAAEAVQGRKEYAHSLLRLAQGLAGGQQPKPLHAIGIFDGNTLERRVMTLLRKPVEMKKARRLVSVAACVAMAGLACGSALALRMNVIGGTAAPASTVNSDQAKKDAKITPVHIVHRVPPVYPAEAKKNPVDGSVVLEATIMTDGTPENVRVVKSLRADYDQSALDAVKDWRFAPAMKNGVPIEVQTHIDIHYSMK